MANLNNITSKIIEDGNKKASEIEEKAKLEGKSILDKYEKKALAKKEEILAKAKAEGLIKVERILSNSVLKIRNEKLRAKQEIVEEIFEEAIKRLSSLKDEELREFIKKSILNLNIDGDEEIIIREEDKDKIDYSFIQSINEELKAKGKIGNIKLNFSKTLKPGFVLSKNGIDINNTFESLVQNNKDTLEQEVISALFKV